VDAGREPQQERSRATRARLLDAAVRVLAERGMAGAGVGAVAEEAGVSRGAAQHHFPTREDLSLAALRHMLDRRGEELRRGVAAVPEGPGRTEAVVRMVVDAFSGVDFRAALQLWAAAASDPVLRERITPLEEHMGREVHRAAVDLLGADESVPGVRETVQATLDLARGLGLANLLTDDGPRRARIVRQWARTLDAVLVRPPGAEATGGAHGRGGTDGPAPPRAATGPGGRSAPG
jgi:AcrR family transcriptional regulator